MQERFLTSISSQLSASLLSFLIEVVGEIDFGACVANSVDVSMLKSVFHSVIEACSSGSTSVFALPAFSTDQPVSQVYGCTEAKHVLDVESIVKCFRRHFEQCVHACLSNCNSPISG